MYYVLNVSNSVYQVNGLPKSHSHRVTKVMTGKHFSSLCYIGNYYYEWNCDNLLGVVQS